MCHQGGVSTGCCGSRGAWVWCWDGVTLYKHTGFISQTIHLIIIVYELWIMVFDTHGVIYQWSLLVTTWFMKIIDRPHHEWPFLMTTHISYMLGHEYRLAGEWHSLLFFNSEDRVCTNLHVKTVTNITEQCQYPWWRHTILSQERLATKTMCVCFFFLCVCVCGGGGVTFENLRPNLNTRVNGKPKLMQINNVYHQTNDQTNVFIPPILVIFHHTVKSLNCSKIFFIYNAFITKNRMIWMHPWHDISSIYPE